MNVRKKVGLGLGVAGLAASSVLLVTGGGPAAAGPAGNLQVLAVTTEQSPDSTVAPKVGDGFAFGGDIYVVRVGERDRSLTNLRHRAKIGRFGVSCVITSVVNHESNCDASVNIPTRKDRGLDRRDGELSVAGLIQDTTSAVTATDHHPRPKPTPTTELDITGGTRAFNAAGGTLIVRDLTDKISVLDFEFAD